MRAIALDPGSANTYAAQGLAYSDMGEYEQAVQNLEKYLELVPDAPNREQILDAIEESKAELNQ